MLKHTGDIDLIIIECLKTVQTMLKSFSANSRFKITNDKKSVPHNVQLLV